MSTILPLRRPLPLAQRVVGCLATGLNCPGLNCPGLNCPGLNCPGRSFAGLTFAGRFVDVAPAPNAATMPSLCDALPQER